MTSIHAKRALPFCLVVACLGACVFAPAASAVLTCSYVEAKPAGSRGNFLKIHARKFEEVVALFVQAGDVIHGRGGGDYLAGVRGTDQLFGESNRDQIDAADDEHDLIDCGLEFDSVTFDRLDDLSHCEYRTKG